MNLKYQNIVGAEVTRLGSGERQGLLTSSPTIPRCATLNSQPSTLNRFSGFTLVEILVVVVLLSFIIVALMAVFNSTQAAFRAGVTQADVLEGGRGVMGLIKNDLEVLTPSFGQSNVDFSGTYLTFIPNNAPVNVCVIANQYQYQTNALPLIQSLTGSSNPNILRTNVLEKFFILTRQNTTWTGTGYVVDTTSTNGFNPLYRFTASANVSAQNMPWGMLYTNFLANTVLPVLPTNATLSHLIDGVVHLTVRAYDPNGYWMTNPVNFTRSDIYHQHKQKRLVFGPAWGEAGFYMFSNTLPATVQVELGVLEDRTLQRALSLRDSAIAQSNYLAQQAGKVHLFRQRFWIRNVDPSAYQ